MIQLLKILKDLQPLIILLIIIWAVVQWKSTGDFIEEREARFKTFKDSIEKVNKGLLDTIAYKELTIDSIMHHNDSIEARIRVLDSSLVHLKTDFDEGIIFIDNTDIDGNISILSRNLSQESTD